MANKKNVSRKTDNLTTEQKQLMDIGRAFRTGRHDKGMKIHELSTASGISVVTISKLEKGQLKNSNLETLNKIAAPLGLSIVITLFHT